MRYAILSDIHSNLEALQAVLEDAGRQEIDSFLCLGDVVGYGANPNECSQKVRELSDHVIVGNHDHAAVELTDISYFNPHAKKAVLWTARVLLPEHSDYFRQLPYTIQMGGFFLTHATASDPPAWHYLLSAQMAKQEFDAFDGRICFIGHSHQPIIFSWKDGSRSWREGKLACTPGDRYIINVGSVGQPRDGDPRACYVIFDDRHSWLHLRRVDYDVQAAQRKILQAGLPPVLAARLANGQ
jgi:diadenosine tetraphosphatase ApaH/serine/threonine PP2A family protein phosphatase